MADKWNIPFHYTTKETAGVSGSGNGFFWQQNNDIRKDSDAGMVRIGKELDSIKIISTTTGEWEFPYDTADYYCLETETGHHSGGEGHGCEGAEYNINVTINESPPKFYFQKQMYHGGTKYTDPKTGMFTHPAITEKIVSNGWKGLCAVRYNKKDGRSADHDSVVLEIWYCDDPDNHKTDGWIKVGATEDKGGWGKGGDTCNGVSDQVINWSNVQFRYKSGTPEWSVHPRIPEFEDGADIHSIGEENMDFAASEKRGYGKRSDMPRDIEMKILFKFDQHDGKARLKNASLREIDPTKATDDNPGTPEPGEEPQETQTIQGKFRLQWDLNTYRISACQGTGIGTEPVTDDDPEPPGGGGGTTGNTRFYIITATDNDKELSNTSTFDNRTRVTEKCGSSSSRMKSKKIIQMDVKLKKTGSPGASPTVRAKIWDSSGSSIYTSPTAIDPTTLTTSFVKKSFDFSTNTHLIVVGDRVGIEYTGTSSSDYVQVPWVDDILDGETGSYVSQFEGGHWDDKNSRDMSMELWE